MPDHQVLISGAGPTGLMLAAELALAGIDVAILERRTTQERIGPGALGLHSRTLEVLDQRGVADRFVSQGTKHQFVHFHIPIDISDFPTRHNYVLGLKQHHIERILAEWVEELRVPVLRGREVTGFTQDEAQVEVTLADGQSLRAEYLVACDGGRSLIRKTAGIGFPGWDATTSWLIAEAITPDEPKWGFHQDAIGIHAIGKAEHGGAAIVLTEAQLRTDGAPTFAEFKQALIGVYGTDFGIHSPRFVSRFTDMVRQAAAYRDRRVLLAGDAAHVHAPLGGQGLNLGMQDAVNLGWKLTQVIRGTSPENLLDTYHAERHPVAARAARNTMAHVVLRRTDEHTKALGEIVSGIFGMEEPRKWLGGMMSGLDVKYELGEGHPLVGRRMPDLEIETDEGKVRVFELLRAARPLLLVFDKAGGMDISTSAGDARVINAEYAAPWELPVVGMVPAPAAVLIRPDGYVAGVRNVPTFPQ
jgi:3-(3-hydroxy-phenyl)propionate hydroxylase